MRGGLMVKRVNILGKKYKVSNKVPKDIPCNEDDFMGLCMDDRGQIFINKNYTRGENYYSTLMHEVGHGTMFRNGLRNSGLIPIEVEEIIVETMANTNYDLFIDILKELKRGGFTTISEAISELRGK